MAAEAEKKHVCGQEGSAKEMSRRARKGKVVNDSRPSLSYHFSASQNRNIFKNQFAIISKAARYGET